MFVFLPKIKLGIINVLYLNQINIDLVHQDALYFAARFFFWKLNVLATDLDFSQKCFAETETGLEQSKFPSHLIV